MSMKRYGILVWLAVFYALVLRAAPVSAQVVTPINHLGWTQPGQTPAQATGTGVSYALYDNGAVTPIPLTGVVCVVGVPATDSNCISNIPPLTVGVHVVSATQVVTVAAGTAESAKSNTVSFTFVIVVTPFGLVLKP